MRLWSLDPHWLDAKGLLACWREGLLARHVLLGLTRGYTHHPQLARFRAHPHPLAFLDAYLSRLVDEADLRGYSFHRDKILYTPERAVWADVTEGQLAYEWQHLHQKIAVRDPVRLAAMDGSSPTPHPCFRVIPGPLAEWERPLF